MAFFWFVMGFLVGSVVGGKIMRDATVKAVKEKMEAHLKDLHIQLLEQRVNGPQEAPIDWDKLFEELQNRED